MVSWNVRGLGGAEKRRSIKEKSNPILVLLQESNLGVAREKELCFLPFHSLVIMCRLQGLQGASLYCGKHLCLRWRRFSEQNDWNCDDIFKG